jgi:hypothetical protein
MGILIFEIIVNMLGIVSFVELDGTDENMAASGRLISPFLGTLIMISP